MTHSILDLTGEQAARVEDAVGLPMTQWDRAHLGLLLPLVLHELEGQPLAEYQAMSMDMLLSMVSLGDSAAGKRGGAS